MASAIIWSDVPPTPWSPIRSIAASSTRFCAAERGAGPRRPVEVWGAADTDVRIGVGAEADLLPGGGRPDRLCEEHPSVAVLDAAARLPVAAPRVVRDVLRHRLVGAEPDLGQTTVGRLAFGVVEQDAAEA